MPAVGAEVDDGAAAGGDHGRSDGLDREEHVAQVGGDALVPVGGVDVLPAVAVVAGGVVDEDAGRALGVGEGGEGALDVADFAEVAALEADGGPRRAELGEEGRAAV